MTRSWTRGLRIPEGRPGKHDERDEKEKPRVVEVTAVAAEDPGVWQRVARLWPTLV